jgi:hypothetical protein
MLALTENTLLTEIAITVKTTAVSLIAVHDLHNNNNIRTEIETDHPLKVAVARDITTKVAARMIVRIIIAGESVEAHL